MNESPSPYDAALDVFRQCLAKDGCRFSTVEELCRDSSFLVQATVDRRPLQEVISRMDVSGVLRLLPTYLTRMSELPSGESNATFEAIEAILRRGLLNQPWRLTSGDIAKYVFRSRELLFLWFTKEEYRNLLLQFMQGYIVSRQFGGASEFCGFAALYYNDLLALYPNDRGFFDVLHTMLSHFALGPALYALTPKDLIPDSFARRSQEKGVETDSLPFWQTDEVIELPGVVRSQKRSDRQFTSCMPQAEYGHSVRSLGHDRGGNTFVFSHGVLLGSLKHGGEHVDDLGKQETFLGMRTVRNADDTFPVIEGGLYLLANDQQRYAIKGSGDRYEASELDLMPVRFAQGVYSCGPHEYVDIIRRRRQELEKS